MFFLFLDSDSIAFIMLFLISDDDFEINNFSPRYDSSVASDLISSIKSFASEFLLIISRNDFEASNEFSLSISD